MAIKEVRYYPDTSIWLDFFENRGLIGKIAKKFFDKVIKEDIKIILSDVVKDELIKYGILLEELKYFISPFKRNLIYVYFNKEQFGKAKDLSLKRNIPRLDALHALIARDNKALVITRDKHFDKLLDIVHYKKPEEVI